MSASNRTEEQSEHTELDHFYIVIDLLALSVSVLCSVCSALFSLSFELQTNILEIKDCFSDFSFSSKYI